MHRSPKIIRAIKSRRLRWAGHVARMEDCSSALNIVTGKRTGRRLLGSSRHRWEDNIRMYIKEICVNTSNTVDSTQGLLENPCECSIESSGSRVL